MKAAVQNPAMGEALTGRVALAVIGASPAASDKNANSMKKCAGSGQCIPAAIFFTSPR
jgi:hypothetical protein